jgi:hypothetical protein
VWFSLPRAEIFRRASLDFARDPYLEILSLSKDYGLRLVRLAKFPRCLLAGQAGARSVSPLTSRNSLPAGRQGLRTFAEKFFMHASAKTTRPDQTLSRLRAFASEQGNLFGER